MIAQARIGLTTGVSVLRRAGGGALDLLLPPRALDAAGGGGAVLWAGLEPTAWSRIRFIETPACDTCGAPFEHDFGFQARCAACQARPPAYDRARAACLYDDHSRDLILKLKHGDRTELANLFAAWVARAAADILGQADVVVPVPLHRWRLLKRRFNQSAEIARPLAARSGLTYWPDVLERPRATTSQAGKSGVGRRRNVAGAFAVSGGRRAQVRGCSILLIDDVLTTGATAEACARALKAAGAARVDVAVIARVKEQPTHAI